MNIVALDLGTHTGYATLIDGVVSCGTWHLATAKEIKQQRLDNQHRCCDIRFGRLQALITGLGKLDVVYFEDVQFSSSTQQTQLWASFRAVVTLLNPAVRVVAIPVGTLKKVATGRGNADKDAMRAALVDVLPVSALSVMDDNAIDAYHLLCLARIDNYV